MDFRPFGFDILADYETEALGEKPASRRQSDLLRAHSGALLKKIAERAPAIRDHTKGSDLIVSGGFADAFAKMAAQHWKVPCICAWLQPILASREIPFPLTKPTRFAMPGWANLAMSLGCEQAIWLIQRAVGRPVRDLYRLPPAGFRSSLRSMIDRARRCCWPTVKLCCRAAGTGLRMLRSPAIGSWTVPRIGSRRRPSSALSRADRPGLCRVRKHEAERPRRDAPRRSGGRGQNHARAVVSVGWGGLQAESLPEFAIGVDAAPHDWLFPRMAAIVHHGGSGTTGEALRARGNLRSSSRLSSTNFSGRGNCKNAGSRRPRRRTGV